MTIWGKKTHCATCSKCCSPSDSEEEAPVGLDKQAYTLHTLLTVFKS